jgi:L-gulonolactone oxidase
MFKRAITFSTHDDTDLAEQAANFGRQHEFADIAWHPGHGEVLYRLDDRVLLNVSGQGVYDFIGFRPLSTSVILANRLAGRYSYCLLIAYYM